MSKVTGLSTTQIEQVATLYGRAKAAFIGWTMGVNHSTQGAVTVAAINNLALITGNIGRSGAAPFSITGQCNAMGTREAGFTSSLPGYRQFDNPAHREELANLWNVDQALIPKARGLRTPTSLKLRSPVKSAPCGLLLPTLRFPFRTTKFWSMRFVALSFLWSKTAFIHPDQ